MTAHAGRRAAVAVAVAAAAALWARVALPLGQPSWADPHLAAPRPTGGYIAANDAWVIVYGEVVYALDGPRSVVQRCRLLLENVAAGPETLTVSVAYDEGQQELADVSLHVQRRIWHEVNLRREATRAGVAGAAQVLLAAAEQIEPGRRVALEYTLTDRLGFNPWVVTLVPREAPIARMRFAVASDAAARGLTLDLIAPAGETPPAGFESASAGAWTVTNVPARHRIGTLSAAFQPHETELFPYFLASVAGTNADSFAAYASHYRQAWSERVAAIDAAPVQAQAEVLVRDATSWVERVGAVARFVQRDIQYDDSNQRSLDSWLPLSTAETLRSRKADCKGKVMILQALLRAIGVESVPVLLRSDASYFSWRDRPGTAFLNHVVLAVRRPADAPEPAATLREGPLAGWVLLDPTVETAAFGQPIPGMEGTPALAVEPEGAVLPLRTRVPSAVRSRVEVEWRLDPVGGADVRVRLVDNGGSPLVARVRSVGADGRERVAREVVGAALAGATVSRCAVRDPWQSASGGYEVDLDLHVAATTRQLGDTLMAESPLALAARLTGIPNGLAAAARPRPEDAVTLAPPWDARRNATGGALAVDVTATLALPADVAWQPPPELSVKREWMRCARTWAARGGGRWEGSFRLEMERGSFSAAERKERLTATDEAFSSLFAPLLLSHPAAP